jgi:hypothetical protein
MWPCDWSNVDIIRSFDLFRFAQQPSSPSYVLIDRMQSSYVSHIKMVIQGVELKAIFWSWYDEIWKIRRTVYHNCLDFLGLIEISLGKFMVCQYAIAKDSVVIIPPPA